MMIGETIYSKNDVIGDYRLVALSGTGCNGEVWSAVDVRTGTLAALKIYRGEDDEAAACAGHEYSSAVRFLHPCILRPTAMFSFGGHPVIVMPYCTGRSVDGVAGYIPELQIWTLLRDVAGALAAVHAAGFGHFDVKPSNILWSGRGFMLSDFGSCRSADGEKCGLTAGDRSSFRFDAPETAGGEAVVLSDVWSLGAAVFCLYMGTHVFNGLGGRAQRPDSPLPYMRKSLPELSGLVCRCLNFKPSLRPSAAEIAEIAAANIERCKALKPRRRPLPAPSAPGGESAAGFWPERMDEN